MKKRFVFVWVMLALLLCFAGCGTQKADFSNGDKAGLVLNKKYIHEGDVSQEEEKQSYFIFLSATYSLTSLSSCSTINSSFM